METAAVPFMMVLFFGLLVLACCLGSAFTLLKKDRKLYYLHYRLKI